MLRGRLPSAPECRVPHNYPYGFFSMARPFICALFFGLIGQFFLQPAHGMENHAPQQGAGPGSTGVGAGAAVGAATGTLTVVAIGAGIVAAAVAVSAAAGGGNGRGNSNTLPSTGGTTGTTGTTGTH